jgi:hypothetical protein
MLASKQDKTRCDGTRPVLYREGGRDATRRSKWSTYVQQGQLDDFAQLLDLLFAAAHVVVRDVGLLLNLGFMARRPSLKQTRNTNGTLDAVQCPHCE